jgi:SAM-dependent methyltransferase
MRQSKLTGERPQEGVTPDSLLALHGAGYRVVRERIGLGRVLDVGCGEGFESVSLAGDGREVVGVDYDVEAAAGARRRFGGAGLHVASMDATALGFGAATFDWVCSSHVIEHFTDPAKHVSEIARVLGPEGGALFLTPNAPADFENPFHVHLFERESLDHLLREYFDEVWVGGLDAVGRVKEDLAARRAKGARLLKLDVFDLRHRLPRSWYIAAYTKLLPLAYQLLARRDSGGSTGISDDDFFVTEEVDDTTLVLFAVGRRPRARAVGRRGSSPSPAG